MPVGTLGTVKGVSPDQLSDLGAQIVLANTYHLHLRPGDKLIKELGGLHRFMNWTGPILTDSGGFQVFSLAKLRKLSERGVQFQSHIDGSPLELTPESVVEIQENLGVDIMMVLDECLAADATREQAKESLGLTERWAERAQLARTRKDTLAFGIVQGGMFDDLREQAAERIQKIGFDGYAIGGLSVGESVEKMRHFTGICAEILPVDRPRYLMGVGTPLDIVESVALGIDMFDCVMPTRSARFGRIFVNGGWINIRNKEHRNSAQPIERQCRCYTCSNFSRAYVSHLFHSKELLGNTLASIHNLYHYQNLMRTLRNRISDGDLLAFVEDFRERWQPPIGEK
ncbi:UNVERIFIED_CONTAM: hypothetical protein GTU68_056437 [Idotea baltica]|nr:hypothetical protein [Idotea baltica]